MLDSQRWKCVEAVPAIAFSIDGLSAVRAKRGSRRGWLTVAEGRVDEVTERYLVLEDAVRLVFSLPPRLDLRPLRGTHVQLALDDEPASGGPRAQTLSITDIEGRPRFIGRFGPAERMHALGVSRVHTALSQRPNGPMAFGTDKLQYVVQVGEHVRVRELAHEYVVYFVARTAFDYAAYVIADTALWVSSRRASAQR